MSGENMEYGAGLMSDRAQRKRDLLWRLHLAKRERIKAIAAVRRAARQRYNTDNKPLGAQK